MQYVRMRGEGGGQYVGQCDGVCAICEVWW